MTASNTIQTWLLSSVMALYPYFPMQCIPHPLVSEQSLSSRPARKRGAVSNLSEGALEAEGCCVEEASPCCEGMTQFCQLSRARMRAPSGESATMLQIQKHLSRDAFHILTSLHHRKHLLRHASIQAMLLHPYTIHLECNAYPPWTPW